GCPLALENVERLLRRGRARHVTMRRSGPRDREQCALGEASDAIKSGQHARQRYARKRSARGRYSTVMSLRLRNRRYAWSALFLLGTLGPTLAVAARSGAVTATVNHPRLLFTAGRPGWHQGTRTTSSARTIRGPRGRTRRLAARRRAADPVDHAPRR